MTEASAAYLLLGLGLPYLSGFALIGVLAEAYPNTGYTRVFRLACAFPLGVLLTSISVHLSWWLHWPLATMTTAALTLCTLTSCFLIHRRGAARHGLLKPARTPMKTSDWLLLAATAAVALRPLPLPQEVLAPPTPPWDAWATWSYQAKALWLTDGEASFMPLNHWLMRGDENDFVNAAHRYPTMIAGYQAWLATWLGEWREPWLNFPWWLALVTLSASLAATAGQLTQRPWLAVAVAYLVASLPLLNAHAALAGYMDLWLACFLACAAIACMHALSVRTPASIGLTLLLLLSLPLIKREGLVWAILAGLAFVLILLSKRQRLLLVLMSLALASALVLIGVDTTLPGNVRVVITSEQIILPFLGSVSLGMELPWKPIGTSLLFSSNWHLLFPLLGLATMLAILIRPRLSQTTRWLAIFAALGAATLALLFMGTNAAMWAEDFTSFDRLKLQWSPIWLLAMIAVYQRVIERDTSKGQRPRELALSQQTCTGPASLAAVVVAHEPPDTFAAELAQLLKLFPLVVLVDNGSGVRTQEHSSLTIIRNRSNLGLAKALNQGWRHAQQRGFEWTVFFDQDSMPGEAIAEVLGNAIRQLETTPKCRAAIVGGRYVSELPNSQNTAATRLIYTRTLITSGTAYKTTFLAQLGGFDEAFFIDHLDNEYCLRARAAGLGVYQLNKPLLRHEIGAPVRVYRFGRAWESSNHNAQRRYYWCRNLILTLMRHGLREPGWALQKLAIEMPRMMIALALLENQAGVKLRACFRGIWHGLSGRTGRWNDQKKPA